MSPEAWIVIGTIGGATAGAVVAGGFNIWNNYINKQFESKQQRKEAIITAGLEYWSTLAHMPDVRGLLGPPELFIAHMSSLFDIIMEDKFDKEKFKQALKDNREFQKECTAIIRATEHSEVQSDEQPQAQSEELSPDDPLSYDPRRFPRR